MNKDELREVLFFFLSKVSNFDISWRLGGGVNLFVQGMNDFNPRDVDILLDNKSFSLLKEVFKDEIVNEGRKNLGGLFFDIEFRGFKLDFFSFDDESKSFLNRKKLIEWEGLKVYVLVLDDTVEYLLKTKRDDKAEYVRQFLLNSD